MSAWRWGWGVALVLFNVGCGWSAKTGPVERVGAVASADTSDAGDAAAWLSVGSLVGMEQVVASDCVGALNACTALRISPMCKPAFRS